MKVYLKKDEVKKKCSYCLKKTTVILYIYYDPCEEEIVHNYFCDKCLITCDRCGEKYPKSINYEINSLIRLNQYKKICPRCAFFCDYCGEYYLKEEMSNFTCHSCGKIYCINCQSKIPNICCFCRG